MKATAFVEHITEILEKFSRSFSVKPMFGGYGVYSDNIIFAIIADDELYFKSDSHSLEFYLKQNSSPFIYEAKGKTIQMSYYKAVPELFEDDEKMREWFEIAKSASLRAKQKVKNKNHS